MRRTNFSNTNKLYRCFCCFHVRNGALALGTWHLMIHLFVICLLAYMSANLDEINGSMDTLTIYIKRGNQTQTPVVTLSPSSLESGSGQQEEPVALPVSLRAGGQAGKSQLSKSQDGGATSMELSPISGSEESISYYWTSFIFSNVGQPVLSQRDLNLAFLLGCITVSIALMLVVGIIKARPAYLIPFLTYQIMDLMISCLTVAGFMCYGPELKDYMLSGTWADFPLRQKVEQLDNQWVTLIIALVIMCVVFVKAYFVQVIWLCIRYLKEENMRRAREECQPKVIYLDNTTTDPELMLFMFDNEGNVVKDKMPPPAYEHCGEEKVAPPAYSAM